jgi:hypothetical protein
MNVVQETTELLRTSDQCQKNGLPTTSSVRRRLGVPIQGISSTTRMPPSLQSKAMFFWVFPGELRRVLRDFREYLGLERREEMREPCHARARGYIKTPAHINLASVPCGTIH